MTPDQFHAQRAVEMAGDRSGAMLILAIIGLSLAIGFVLWLVVMFGMAWQDRRWDGLMASRAMHPSNRWPEDCDGSYLCTARRHVPGCFADPWPHDHDAA